MNANYSPGHQQDQASTKSQRRRTRRLSQEERNFDMPNPVRPIVKPHAPIAAFVQGALAVQDSINANSITQRLIAPTAPAQSALNTTQKMQFNSAPVTRGQRVGPYVVLEEISRGGMGLVVKARHHSLDLVCALKFLLNPHPTEEEVRRFRREARVLEQLDHPNVLQVTDFGVQSNLMYFAMEYIEGQDLRQIVEDHLRLRRKPPATDWLARVAAAMASALHYCHREDVVHRDMKPQNILIETESQRPVLCDFGLTKVLSDNGDTTGRSFSKSGTIWGTPVYMSPEQLVSDGTFGTIGPATDTWSLGASLFFAVTGQTPYLETELLELYKAIRQKDPRDPRELYKDLDPWFAELINACLQRRPEERIALKDLVAKVEEHCGPQNLPSMESEEQWIQKRLDDADDPSLFSWIRRKIKPEKPSEN